MTWAQIQQMVAETRKAVVGALAIATVLVTEGILTGQVAHDVGYAAAIAGAAGIWKVKNRPPAIPAPPSASGRPVTALPPQEALAAAQQPVLDAQAKMIERPPDQ